jgi:hypothetical protein
MAHGARCFFASVPGAGPCGGRLVRCHLIPKALLKREFPHGAVRLDGHWHRLTRATPAKERVGLQYWRLSQMCSDPRSWVLGCGGPMGVSGHHGRLDVSRTLRVPRALLPAAVEEFAAEYGLTWWLTRTYGELERSTA